MLEVKMGLSEESFRTTELTLLKNVHDGRHSLLNHSLQVLEYVKGSLFTTMADYNYQLFLLNLAKREEQEGQCCGGGGEGIN